MNISKLTGLIAEKLNAPGYKIAAKLAQFIEDIKCDGIETIITLPPRDQDADTILLPLDIISVREVYLNGRGIPITLTVSDYLAQRRSSQPRCMILGNGKLIFDTVIITTDVVKLSAMIYDATLTPENAPDKLLLPAVYWILANLYQDTEFADADKAVYYLQLCFKQIGKVRYSTLNSSAETSFGRDL